VNISIDSLQKAFESRVRLGIMSILILHDWVEFVELKNMLMVTDGNLASHLSALEKLQCIQTRKQFIGNKPNTSYATTTLGRESFRNHLNALEDLIKGIKR
jgi:DNA-binding HxlR family transcriptional regulator